jgi:hypothetical protein
MTVLWLLAARNSRRKQTNRCRKWEEILRVVNYEPGAGCCVRVTHTHTHIASLSFTQKSGRNWYFLSFSQPWTMIFSDCRNRYRGYSIKLWLAHCLFTSSLLPFLVFAFSLTRSKNMMSLGKIWPLLKRLSQSQSHEICSSSKKKLSTKFACLFNGAGGIHRMGNRKSSLKPFIGSDDVLCACFIGPSSNWHMLVSIGSHE